MSNKPFLLIISICLFNINYVVAQSLSPNYFISGQVIDSLTKKPLDYATITLNTSTGVQLKAVYTKTDGSFKLDKLAEGRCIVAVITTGYATKIIPVDVKHNINLGDIELAASSRSLDEVKVTAARPIIKQEADRIVYDIQADPDSKMQNMLDMMRKVPLLSLDAGDNLRLKGNSDFKILVNGRPSGMMARNPRDALRAMRASNILKVEVITTPPAKYDGEGLAGIINIITKKRVDQGYNGDVGLYYITYESHGTWTDLNVKEGKFGATVYAEGFIRNGPSLHFNNYRQSTNPVSQKIEQDGSNDNSNSGRGMYITTDLSYEIDSLNLLTGNIGFFPDKINRYGNLFTSVYGENNTLQKQYLLNDAGNYKRGAVDAGFNYQLGFKGNKDRLLTVSYKYSWANINQDNLSIASRRIGYNEDDLRQQNDAGSKEQTIQLDYVHPLKSLSIEGGIKAIFRDNGSNFTTERYVPDNGPLIPDSTILDKFKYQQRVYSFYNAYNYKFNKYNNLKAGLRLERTTNDADFITLNTAFNNSYNNFIPSVAMQHRFNDESSINLGYTQRIQRPNIWQLNPFVNKVNPLFYTSGNPDLLPVINHNFEFNYSKFSKGSFVAGLSYSFANNTIQNVVVLGADSISRASFQNIGKNNNLGIDVNVNYPFTNNISINVSARLSYTWLNGIVNGNNYNNNGVQGYLNSNWSYGFGKDWRLAADLNYTGRSLSLQGETNGFVYSGLRISKDVFNKQAAVMLAIINPLSTYRNMINTLSTAGFIQQYSTRVYARGVHINFYYRFGRLKEAIKKNKRGVSNDDVEKMK